MIIGLVRDSVLQCFCHTCRTPLISSNVNEHQVTFTKIQTPKTSQPSKAYLLTTEVRCQEKKKGGLKYEVILGEPDLKLAPPKKLALSTSPRNPVSTQDIEEKLKAAEERRLKFECNRMAQLSAEMMKIAEVSRKKDEQTGQFICGTRNALQQKMVHYTENREAYITDLKMKIKDHMENIEKTRLNFEHQTNEIKLTLEEKMKTASVQRDENIKKMLERLKEHNLHTIELKHVTKSNQENSQLKTFDKIESKLARAEENRGKHIEQKIENLKDKEKQAEVVRQNKAMILDANGAISPSN